MSQPNQPTEEGDIEEGHIREVREDPPAESDIGGGSVVRLRKERRRRWWLVPLLLLLFLFLFLLLKPEKEEARVSLPAAKTTLLKESPSLQKVSVLRALRKDGFRAVPGPPRSPIEITVSVRRDGLILRSQSERLWVPREKLKRQE